MVLFLSAPYVSILTRINYLFIIILASSMKDLSIQYLNAEQTSLNS